jgi:hypothetical protein
MPEAPGDAEQTTITEAPLILGSTMVIKPDDTK